MCPWGSGEERSCRSVRRVGASSAHPPSPLLSAGLSAETRPKCVPGPAAGAAPGALTGQSRLQSPGSPPSPWGGWVSQPASLLKGQAVLRAGVLGRDAELALCAAEPSCVTATGCALGGSQQAQAPSVPECPHLGTSDSEIGEFSLALLPVQALQRLSL